MATAGTSIKTSENLTGIKFVFRALRHRNYQLFFPVNVCLS